MPIHVARTESGEVDLDALYVTVQPLMQKKLPGAYFRGAVLFTSCEKMAQLEGRLVLDFERVKFGFPRRRVERISANVRTEQQRMDTFYQDDTNRYPAVKVVDFSSDLETKQMLAIAQRHLESLGATPCTVVISQLGDATWIFNCTDPTGTKLACYFNVQDGEVRKGEVR